MTFGPSNYFLIFKKSKQTISTFPFLFGSLEAAEEAHFGSIRFFAWYRDALNEDVLIVAAVFCLFKIVVVLLLLLSR